MNIEAEMGVMQSRAKDTRSPQKLDTALAPSEGAWPCLHLYFRLPASRTLREEIPVVYRYFATQPQDTDLAGKSRVLLKQRIFRCPCALLAGWEGQPLLWSAHPATDKEVDFQKCPFLPLAVLKSACVIHQGLF